LRTIVFLLFFIVNLLATPLVELNQTNQIATKFYVNYLFDKNSTSTIDDISKMKFTKTSKSSFALGYTDATVWIKFKLKNETQYKDFILTLNENFYEKANLYYKENNNWEKKQNGVFKSLKQRDVKSNDLAFNIHMEPFEQKVFYIQLQGKYSYFGNIEIYEQSYFQYNNTLNKNEFHIALIGIIFTIVLFSFLLFINTYEKIYLYYLGYALFNGIFLLISSGLLVFIDLQKYMYKFYPLIPFLFICLILFSKEFLQIKKYLKNMDKILNIFIVLFALCALLIFFSFTPWNKVINFLVSVTMLFLIIISIIIFFKGNNNSKYYIFAMLVYSLGVIVYTLTVQGVLEYQALTRYGYLVALLIEIVTFSILLANRYTTIKEKMESYLKLQVDKRTKKIEKLLDDKELLLKELHHRVENNFHMIIGMLYIENKKKDYVTNGLDGLINRIEAISIVHEYLYNSKNISQVNLEEYLNELFIRFTNTYSVINLRVNIDPVVVNLDEAISLGMIINELITNSVKHNKHIEDITVDIVLKEENDFIVLVVEDNGENLKKENLKKKLGLKLIDQFCNKLVKSEYNFKFEMGTKFTLRFMKVV